MWKWQRATMARCRARMMRRCEIALSRWAEYVDERRAMRALVARVFGRLVNGETAKGFNGWRRACADARHRGGGRGARRARRVTLVRAFAAKAALSAAMRLFDVCSGACSRRGRHAREEKRQRLVSRASAPSFGARARAALATWVETVAMWRGSERRWRAAARA